MSTATGAGLTHQVREARRRMDRKSTPTIVSAQVDGSGTAVTDRSVRLLLLTTPEGGRSVALVSSKLPGPRAGSVGRASFTNIGREEKSLKSAWKDTTPPPNGGNRAGAWTLISMACTALNVMRISLPAPKLAESSIVTS